MAMKSWTVELDVDGDAHGSRAHEDGCGCRGGNCGSVDCGCGHTRPDAVGASILACGGDLAYKEDAERLFRVIGMMMKQLNDIRRTKN
jgi:hypothetical protein